MAQESRRERTSRERNKAAEQGRVPEEQETLTRKEAALVELVGGAASFTGDGWVPKESAVSRSEENANNLCVAG
jgi:hypothetical protein